MRILDRDAMREVDRTAIEELGIPSMVLMENAAIGLADAIGEAYPVVSSAAIFCGPGNNGGDGLALARHLSIRGYQVEVYVITGGKPLQGDARLQLGICQNQPLAIKEYGPGDPIDDAIDSANRLDLVVDALFGTGLARPLADHYATLVEAINLLPIPCVAVDIPSGLDGSSAAIVGPHIQAELTVTFAAPKIAHVMLPAAEVVGEVVVADLGIPTRLIEDAGGSLHLLEDRELVGLLPARALTSHKGDYGHALIVAGSVGKSGAAILAARAAVRAGTGLVTVATPEPVTQTVDLGSLESMTLPLEMNSNGGLGESSLQAILIALEGKQTLAVGPGLGTDPTTIQVVRSLVERAEVPLVLDADGLNAFAGRIEELANSEGERVLTPHPGELARLLQVGVDDVQGDRLASAASAAALTRSVVVLKGHQTLIADPGGLIFVNPTGNPGLATGGSGDVLTGVITGFLSQGLQPLQAACLGVFIHGLAGDRVAAERGQEVLIASDLLDELSPALMQVQA